MKRLSIMLAADVGRLLDGFRPRPVYHVAGRGEGRRVAQGLDGGQDRRRPGQRVEGRRGATRDGKKVLAQTSDQGRNRFFNLCVAENTSFTDIDLTVAFKAMAGKLDQGGGPVWRYKDADNYYIARMNPLEDNYRVYKVVAGKRTQLGSRRLSRFRRASGTRCGSSRRATTSSAISTASCTST